MSKTDKTTLSGSNRCAEISPLKRFMITATRVCDMPSDADAYHWAAWQRPRCYRSFVYTGVHVCCCAMCHAWRLGCAAR